MFWFGYKAQHKSWVAYAIITLERMRPMAYFILCSNMSDEAVFGVFTSKKTTHLVAGMSKINSPHVLLSRIIEKVKKVAKI